MIAIDALVAEWRSDAEKLRQLAIKSAKRGDQNTAIERMASAQDADGYADQLETTLAALRAEAGAVGDGLSLIVAERHRQITAEGWTFEHDDFYQDDELARAAACYVLPEKARPYDRRRGFQLPSWWPETWRSEWWKPTPKDRVRELVKAGALIAAEIDRTQRASLAQARRTDSRD
jgi:hypothetical protein